VKEYKDNWYQKKKLAKIDENENKFEDNSIQSI
jgi:hypothetical protein